MCRILLTIVTALLAPLTAAAPVSSLNVRAFSDAVLRAITPVTPTMATSLPSLHARDSVNPGEQSCSARDRGPLVINYAIHIGAKFDQDKCDDAIDRIKNNCGVVSYARCYDDEEGGTWLKFNDLPGWGEEINAELDQVWGDEINGFNCPDWRVANNGTQNATNGTQN